MSDSFATPWTVACQAPLSMVFPRQEHWSGLPFSSQGIFPTQGSNPCLLYWQAIFYHWATREAYTATAAKSLQSCLTLCDPIYRHIYIILFDWRSNLFFLLFYWVWWDLKNYCPKAPNSRISSIMPFNGYKTPSRWGCFLRKLIFPFYRVKGNIYILKFASLIGNLCIWSYPEEI